MLSLSLNIHYSPTIRHSLFTNTQSPPRFFSQLTGSRSFEYILSLPTNLIHQRRTNLPSPRPNLDDRATVVDEILGLVVESEGFPIPILEIRGFGVHDKL